MHKKSQGYINKYTLLFLLYTLGITVLSLSRLDNKTPRLLRFEYADKLVHTAFYVVFTVLLGLAIRQTKRGVLKRSDLIWVSVVGIVYGGGVELAQKFLTHHRSAELADLGANALGVLLGVFLLTRFKLRSVIFKNLK